MSRVGGITNILEVSVPNSTDAYAAGDDIGGLLEITNAVRGSTGATKNLAATGLIQSVRVVDQSRQGANVDVWFFESQPGVNSFVDNSPLNIASADLLTADAVQVRTHINVASGTISKAANLALPYKINSGTSLFAAVVAQGTPTYVTSGQDLTLRVGLMQD